MSGGRSARDLAEWLAYLREIGVRDLAIRGTAPPPARAGSRGATAEGREAPGVVLPGISPGGAPQAELFSLVAGSVGGAVDPEKRLREIRDEIGDCRRCRLCEGRTHIVFGVGDPHAKLMFVGEGPGADEDAQGEPFVGRAGQKLNEMIRAIGLQRDAVYIGNVVKCRPPNNRDPQPDEIAVCSPFLFAQIEAIRPSVIVALGSPAAKTLLASREGITAIRGRWHAFRGIPVMPTFHPAYLLRAYTKENRQKVWDDLRAARTRVDEDS